MIPFLDLQAATRELKAEIDGAIARVVSSGWYIGGPEVTAFESDWAAFCGAKHAVGVGNGLDALHLALKAVGVGPGDEVILASNGYIATQLAVSMVGATPVAVEPDSATHNLDPNRIAAAITTRTKAILPTHLYGQPADLDAIGAIAAEHSLTVIDDAAQAHGARYKGAMVGGYRSRHSATITCWSFYPSKNLGALGDGGAITTDDVDLSNRIRRLANYGSSVRYVHRERGTNSRLDPIQAAVLRVKLAKLEEWNDRRRSIATYYTQALAGTQLVLPYVPSWSDPAWHLYVVQSDRREWLAAQLEGAGIQTLVHYPIPPHRQGAYADLCMPEGSFPIAERLAKTVLSLPIGPHLATSEADQVVDAIRWAERL